MTLRKYVARRGNHYHGELIKFATHPLDPLYSSFAVVVATFNTNQRLSRSKCTFGEDIDFSEISSEHLRKQRRLSSCCARGSQLLLDKRDQLLERV